MSSPVVIGIQSAEIDGPQLSPRRTSLIGAPSDPPLSPVSPSPSTPRKPFESSGGCLSALRAAWHLYSLGDWIVALVAYLVLGGIQLLSARHRFVPNPKDGAINYPVMPSTVPMPLLMVLAILLPVIVMFAVFFFRRKTHKFAKAELSAVLSGLMLATGITALATDIIKKAVGRPRPNFIEYCGFEDGHCDPALSLGTVNDAYASFPSGHASFSFSGLTFLSLYLLTLVPTLRRVRRYPLFSSLLGSSPIAQPEPSRPALGLPAQLPLAQPPCAKSPRLFLASAVGSREAWLWVLCVSPVFLAGWIAMTRIIDYWHWFDDVLAGSLLGFCVAHFVGAFKFPPPQVALFAADHSGPLCDDGSIDLYVGSPSTESEPTSRCTSETPLPVSVVIARADSR